MSSSWRLAWLGLVGCGLYVIVRHHAAYLFRRRATTFAAFLGTAGWIVVMLVALVAVGGGLNEAGTRLVELVVGLVGLALIGIGWRSA